MAGEDARGLQPFSRLAGVNGRWRDRLSAADIAAYGQRAVRELGPECARWLAEGGPVTVSGQA